MIEVRKSWINSKRISLTISGVCGAGLSKCTSRSYSLLWSLVLTKFWNNFRRNDASRASWSMTDAYCIVVLNWLSQSLVGVFCWSCMNVKYGRSTASTSFGNIGGNVNSVWQLLSRTIRACCWLLSLLKMIFCSRSGQSSGLGTVCFDFRNDWNKIKI